MPASAIPTRKIILGGGILLILAGAWVRNFVFPSDKTLVTRQVKSLVTAFERRDRDTVTLALSDDFVLENDRGNVFPREVVMTAVRRTMRDFPPPSIRITELTVDILPNRGVARFSTVTHYRTGYGGAQVHRGDWRAEFVKREGRWKLARFRVLGEGI